MKAKLDKLLKAKDQALSLYESIKIEWAEFAAKEKDYKDRLSKMAEELDEKLISKLKLLDEIKP